MPLRVAVDREARPIPDWAEEAFEVCEAISECVERIEAAIDQLVHRKQLNRNGMQLIAPGTVREAIRKAVLPLYLGQPWAVCPNCADAGTNQRPCSRCHGRGWLTRAELAKRGYHPRYKRRNWDENLRTRKAALAAELERIEDRLMAARPPRIPAKLKNCNLNYVEGRKDESGSGCSQEASEHEGGSAGDGPGRAA